MKQHRNEEPTSFAVKDDQVLMEFPFFSLAKAASKEIKEVQIRNCSIRIIPSREGAPTVWDKDILIYAISKIVDERNAGADITALEKNVTIRTIEFMEFCERSTGGDGYNAILTALRRLKGSVIETDVPTGDAGVIQTRGFSFIDNYEILAVGKSKKVLEFSVTLSDWTMNSLRRERQKGVLTLDRKYFSLKKSVHRCLYEIARKFCGQDELKMINLELLRLKSGSTDTLAKFRAVVNEVIKEDCLPGYRFALDGKNMVVIYSRDTRSVLSWLKAKDKLSWFFRLKKYDNFGRES